MQDSEGKNPNAQALSRLGASRGGLSRASKLSSEERAAIGRKGALARWRHSVPVALYIGTMELAGRELSCAVLEDEETRVLTQATLLRAMGRSRSPKARTGIQSSSDAGLPTFMAAPNLQQFISDDLREMAKPIRYRHGQRIMLGYNARVLSRVCDVYLNARDADALLPSQQHIADACYLLMRGLSDVGIVALILMSRGRLGLLGRLGIAQYRAC